MNTRISNKTIYRLIKLVLISTLIFSGQLFADKESQQESTIAVFGQSLFNGQFAKTKFTGFNPDYQIGIGDQINVKMWGAHEYSSKLDVDIQGNIFIPQVGPVHVLGVKNDDLNRKLELELQKVYQSNVSIYANLITSQDVKVFVTGFVKMPGLYGGYSSESILTYLDRAGGIDPNRGSFLKIELLRNNQAIKHFDLYSFIFWGKIPQTQLRDGDTLVVGPLQKTVQFSGLVQNAMRYEFTTPTLSLKKALDKAGPLPNATNVRVTRNQGSVRNIEYYSIFDIENITLYDGDEFQVTADKKAGTISVRVEGEHDSKSEYVLPYNANLGDLLKGIKYTELSDQNSIQLFRKSSKDRQKKQLQANLKRVESSVLTARSATSDEASLRAKEAELILQWVERAKQIEPKGQIILSNKTPYDQITLENGDLIKVPIKTKLVSVFGEVMFPGTQVHENKATLRDYITRSGGYSQNQNSSLALVIHRNGTFSLPATEINRSVLRTKIEPGDEIMILPKIDTKNLQITKEVTQIIYQIAVAAAVVL